MSDTASTAQQIPSTSQDEGPNALATDLNDDELLAFVDKTLGPQPKIANSFGNSTPLPSPNELAKTEPTEPAEAAKPESSKEEPKQEEPAKPIPAAKSEEPKEEAKPAEIPAVDTSDLWIEVQGVAVDAEGKQSDKTYKITLDDGIPDEMRFKDDKQLAEVLDAMNEMRALRAERQQAYDDAVAKQEQQSVQDSSQQQLVTSWDSEIADLIQAGLLDAPKAAAQGQNGYTPDEVAADPALQRIDAVFTFMTEENTRRKAEGKSLLTSFGTTFNLFQRQERTSKEAEEKKQQEEAEKKQAEEIKRRGAMVGGGSGAAASGGKTAVYKVGSAKSIYDIDTSDL